MNSHMSLVPDAGARAADRSLRRDRGKPVLARRGRSGTAATPVGLEQGTLVSTSAGHLPAEVIEPGMLVNTENAGAQQVLAVLKSQSTASSDDAPVTFPAGCIGNIQSLTLNPQHCIVMTSRQCLELYGVSEVFVPALFLAGGHGTPRPGPSVFYQLLFREHQIVFANGVMVESFYAGPTERETLDAEAKGLVDQALPELVDPFMNRYGPRARLRLTRREFAVLMGLGDGLTLPPV